MAQTSKYKRVILKLSGEALAGDKGFGINPIIITNRLISVSLIRC